MINQQLELVESDATKTPGRPSKLDAEIIERIYTLVRGGMPKTRAAAIVGIAKSTFYSWMEKAEQEGNEGTLYVELMDTVAMAQAEFMQEGIQEIIEEGPSGYRWLLSKLFAEFSDRVAIDLPNTMKLQIGLPGMGPGELPDEIEEQ